MASFCDVCGKEVKETRACRMCGSNFCEECGSSKDYLCNNCNDEFEERLEDEADESFVKSTMFDDEELD
jgi:hypothetical protein